MKLFQFTEDNGGTVSYTHLDVYKRQLITILTLLPSYKFIKISDSRRIFFYLLLSFCKQENKLTRRGSIFVILGGVWAHLRRVSL